MLTFRRLAVAALLALGLALPIADAMAGASAPPATLATTALVSSFFDDFERTDQTGLGTAPTGQTWSLTGAGQASASIVSGRFTDGAAGADNVVYAGIMHAAQPLRMCGSFSFAAGGGASSNYTATMILSADSSIQLDKMIHLVIQPSNYALSWWSGASQNNAFQSGPPGDQVGFSPPLSVDGTVYTACMSVVGNNVHIELPDGRTHDYYDPNVAALAGKLAIWELTYSSTSAGIPRWESVRTFQPAATTLGTLTAPGGIEATPIGHVTPSSGYFNQVGIGTAAPGQLLDVQADAVAADAARFTVTNQHAQVRVKAPTAGFSPIISLDQGQSAANVVQMYSAGNSQDFRVKVGGSDQITVPLSGNISLGRNLTLKSGCQILTGSGAPAVSAPVCSLYLRTDGGAASTLYVKESGTGSTGWAAK